MRREWKRGIEDKARPSGTLYCCAWPSTCCVCASWFPFSTAVDVRAAYHSLRACMTRALRSSGESALYALEKCLKSLRWGATPDEVFGHGPKAGRDCSGFSALVET